MLVTRTVHDTGRPNQENRVAGDAERARAGKAKTIREIKITELEVVRVRAGEAETALRAVTEAETMREIKITETGSPTTGERETVAEKAKRARDARREIRLGESAGGSDEARKAKNVKDEKKRRPRVAEREMRVEETKTERRPR